MATIEKFYALSTCIHCRHTKDFLEENNIPFTAIYVDKLNGAEQNHVLSEMRQYNPDLSFPTIVFSDGNVVVGFQQEKLSEELGLVNA